MLRRFCLLTVALAAAVARGETADVKPTVDLSHGPLRVSDDDRWLVHADGTPFFYLGDTAWELFHRTTREEADLYLADRAAKGFTVIQAVVLAELDGLNTPNSLGDRPLIDNDPTRPNDAYFKHVDYVVGQAQKLGLHIGMLPTWGDKWNKKWGVGPVVFNAENAEAYGKWLGARYKEKPIIWILGGDRNPESDEQQTVIRAMARGLAEGDGGRHLMTYHPQGGGAGSSAWFHKDDWLDFNMFQSGHSRVNLANYEITLHNRELIPTKPVLDGEPRYEDHPIAHKPEQGWFDEWDVRQAAYWSMLAGALGHTYGNHNIWQMWQPGRRPISAARTPWKTALKHPGSAQVGYLRKLLESYAWQKLVPDQSLLAGDAGQGAAHRRAARAQDSSFALVYTPMGESVSIKLNKLRGNPRAQWFDPRSGELQAASGEDGVFDPPGDPGRGNDWLLVLDRR